MANKQLRRYTVRFSVLNFSLDKEKGVRENMQKDIEAHSPDEVRKQIRAQYFRFSPFILDIVEFKSFGSRSIKSAG